MNFSRNCRIVDELVEAFFFSFTIHGDTNVIHLGSNGSHYFPFCVFVDIQYEIIAKIIIVIPSILAQHNIVRRSLLVLVPI